MTKFVVYLRKNNGSVRHFNVEAKSFHEAAYEAQMKFQEIYGYWTDNVVSAISNPGDFNEIEWTPA